MQTIQLAVGTRATEVPGPIPASAGQRSADHYVVGLQLKLAINPSQVAAWDLFAESLRGNRRRMQDFDDMTDHPFGTLNDRLAACDAMQRAASDLFAVLERAQQQTAVQLLPLCCLPQGATRPASETNARAA